MRKSYKYYSKKDAELIFEKIEDNYAEFYKDCPDKITIFNRRSGNSENEFWNELVTDTKTHISENFEYTASTAHKFFKANKTASFKRHFRIQQIDYIDELSLLYETYFYKPETKELISRDSKTEQVPLKKEEENLLEKTNHAKDQASSDASSKSSFLFQVTDIKLLRSILFLKTPSNKIEHIQKHKTLFSKLFNENGLETLNEDPPLLNQKIGTFNSFSEPIYNTFLCYLLANISVQSGGVKDLFKKFYSTIVISQVPLSEEKRGKYNTVIKKIVQEYSHLSGIGLKMGADWKLSQKTTNKLKKWDSFATIISACTAIFFVILALWGLFENSKKTKKVVQEKSKIYLASTFTKTSHDSLYILISRFKNQNPNIKKELKQKQEELISISIHRLMNRLIQKYSLPIAFDYKKEILPKDDESARRICEYHNADILLWSYGYFDNNNKGDIRFRFTPSKKIGLDTDNTNLEGNIKYNKDISFAEIEEGKFTIDSLDFESWLRSILKTKVAKYNPEFFIINDTLSVKDKAAEYHKLSKIYQRLFKTDKALEFATKSIQLDPLNPIHWAFRAKCKRYSKEAILDIKKAIELDVLNPEFKIQLAEIYAKKYNYVEAEKLYNRAIELNPYSSSVWIKRAFFYYIEKNDYYKARADFNKAIELEPTDYQLIYYRAEFYSHYKKYDLAEKDYKTLIKVNPLDIYAWYMMSEFYKNFNKFKKAEETYNKALNHIPSNLFLLNLRAQFYESLNNYDKAETDYIKATELDSLNGFYWTNLADYYNRINDRKKAKVYFNKAIEIDTLNRVYWLGKRAGFYGYNHEKIENDYNKIIELDSLNPENWIARANFNKSTNSIKANADYIRAIALTKSDIEKAGIYEKMGNYPKAEELYIKLVNSNERNRISRAYFYERYAKKLWRSSYSQLYKLIEKKEIGLPNEKNIKRANELLKKAQDDYSFSINSNPNNPRLLFSRAEFYIKIEKFEKAEQDYDKLEILIPHVSGLWRKRADFYQKSKREYKKAINDLTQAIKLDSLNPNYLLKRADLYKIEKDTLKAEKDYTSVIRLDSFNPYNWLNRANFYKSIKSNIKAEEDYIQAIKQNPFDYRIWDSRIKFYRSTGQKNKLIEDYKRVALLWYKDFGKVNTIMTSLQKMRENEVRIQICTKLIERDPLNLRYIRYRAIGYHHAKMYDKAIEDYTTLIHINPKDLQSWKSRINLYKKIKRYDKVESDYNQLSILDSLNSRWLNTLVNFSLEIENYEDAETYFGKVISLDSSKISSWKKRAGFYHKRVFKFDKAEKDYTKVIELDSSNSSSWQIRAKFYKELGLYKKAEEDYSQAIENNKIEKLSNLSIRASFYESIGEFEKAENDFNQFVLTHYDPSYATKQKRDFYTKIGNYKKSLATHFEYLKTDSISFEIEKKYPGKNRHVSLEEDRSRISYFSDKPDKDWRNLLTTTMIIKSNKYFKNIKNYPKKEKYFSELIKTLISRYSNSNNYKIPKVKLSAFTKDYNKAIAEYTKILESSEKVNSSLLIKRAKIYNKLGETSKAEVDFNRAIKLDATIFPNFYNRAEFYKKEKRYKKAIADYEKALSCNLTNIDKYTQIKQKNGLLFILANLYRKINSTKKAEGYYSKIIQKDTLTPYYWKLRGDFYFSINQPEKGKSDFNKAKSLEAKYLIDARRLIDSAYIEPQIKRKKGHMAYFEKFQINPYPEGNSDDFPYKDIRSFKKEITSDSSFFSLIKSKIIRSRLLIHNRIKKFNKLYAIEDYTNKIKLDSTNSYNWVLRGDYFTKIGDIDNAALDYEKAISVDSTNTMRWKSKALFHLQQQDYKIAINHFEKSIALFDLSDNELLHELWFEKGVSHYKLKQYQIALQDISKAQQLYPNYKTLFYLLYMYFINYWYFFVLVLAVILIVTVKRSRIFFLEFVSSFNKSK